MGKATLAWGLILPGNQGFLQSWVAVTVSRHPQSNKASISGKHDLTHRGEESKTRLISSLSLAGHSSARRALEGSRGERMWPAPGKRWWAAPTTGACLSPAKGNSPFGFTSDFLSEDTICLGRAMTPRCNTPHTDLSAPPSLYTCRPGKVSCTELEIHTADILLNVWGCTSHVCNIAASFLQPSVQ